MTPESWQKLAERVAASATFQKSPRLRKLLLHLCQQMIEGRTEQLREQAIGCQVFGRPSDYSPSEDNIVRVEVRRLRKRLEEYFSGEGSQEPVVIVIPKGSYLPVFKQREAPEAKPAVSEEDAAAPPETRGFRLGRLLWVAAAAVLVAVATAVGFWVSNGQRRLAAVRSAETAGRAPLWPLLFNENAETRIVCADASLVLARAINHRPISLEDYMRSNYAGKAASAPQGMAGLFASLPHWHWTDLADVRIVDNLHRMNHSAWYRTSIRTARLTQIDDFTNGNVILLGSAQSNPWNHLFEQQLNFWIDWDEKSGVDFVRNRSPLPGEPATYGGAMGGDASLVFSVVAFLPNLRRSGDVLIVAGTTGQGTETAGAYITTPETYHRLMNMVMRQRSGKLPYFEVLLQSRVLAGVAKEAEVVAVRTTPRP